MPKKDPAFLFYSSDFLTGVSDLTMQERGQYITLLCLIHQKGRLSDKAIKLNTPSVSIDVLTKFDKDEDGNLYNKRLDEVINERKSKSEINKLIGTFAYVKNKVAKNQEEKSFLSKEFNASELLKLDVCNTERLTEWCIKRLGSRLVNGTPFIEDEDIDDNLLNNNREIEKLKIRFEKLYPKATNPISLLTSLQELPKEEQKKAVDYIPKYLEKTEERYYSKPEKYLSSYCWNDKESKEEKTPKLKKFTLND